MQSDKAYNAGVKFMTTLLSFTEQVKQKQGEHRQAIKSFVQGVKDARALKDNAKA